MHARPATRDDLPTITELQRTWDTAWFGAPEHDTSEVAEELDRVDPLGRHSRLVFDGSGRLDGAGWRAKSDATLLVRPGVPRPAVRDDLLDWFAATSETNVPVLARDVDLRDEVTRRGWRHGYSSFELIRALTQDWALEAPVWPDGVDVRPLRGPDLVAVHRLVYRDAEWSEVPGHVDREFDEWHALFVHGGTAPDQQVLAWRGERLVGAALGRIFSDGTGWVSQLAVSATARRVGLGRALLLEAFARRRAAGARALGLGVQAANDGALALYLDVGLRIDREWQAFTPYAP